MTRLTGGLIKSIFLILSVFICRGGRCALSAQTVPGSEHNSVEIYFRSGSSEYEPRYRSNAARVSRFVAGADALSRGLETGRVKVTFSASASPDGGAELNARLASERLRSASSALLEAGLDPGFLSGDAVDSYLSGTMPLDALAETVRSSTYAYKSAILDILDDVSLDEGEKASRLRSAEGGRCWRWLSRECFPGMRSFRAVVRVERDGPLAEVKSQASPESLLAESPRVAGGLAPRTGQLERAVLEIADAEEESPASPDRGRILTLKTNIPALGLLLANAAAEVGIAERLTLHVPLYYSAVDYFSRTVKFRSIAVQPELRWYFPKIDGLFAGVHLGVAGFNLAGGGDWRVQDRGGDTPLLGGGLSLGWRTQFSGAPRWGLELSLGAGAYRLSYDRFVNEPNGPYVDTVDRTYVGIDGFSVSLTYDFDLGRARRRRKSGSVLSGSVLSGGNSYNYSSSRSSNYSRSSNNINSSSSNNINYSGAQSNSSRNYSQGNNGHISISNSNSNNSSNINHSGAHGGGEVSR